MEGNQKMKNTEQGVSPCGRISSSEDVKLLKYWSFKFFNKFIILELFNKKVVIKSSNSRNEKCISFATVLVTILTLTSIGDL